MGPLVTPRTGKERGEARSVFKGDREGCSLYKSFAVVETKKLSFKCDVIETAKRKQASKEAEETLPPLGWSSAVGHIAEVWVFMHQVPVTRE